MGLNVSTTVLENREYLKNAAKNILSQNNASQDSVSKIVDRTVFDIKESYVNPQLSVIKAATQISVNSTLNETLKYLKSHANNKSIKKPVLGELWNILSANNESSEENPYKGELYDFKIDDNVKNIFAA